MICLTASLVIEAGIEIGDQGIRKANVRGAFGNGDQLPSVGDRSSLRIMRANVLRPLKIVQETDPSDERVLVFLNFKELESVELNSMPLRLLGNRLIIVKPFDVIEVSGSWSSLCVSETHTISHHGDHILYESFHIRQRIELTKVDGRVECHVPEKF